MKANERLINRRKLSANWSSLNPEERSILTANQLNAQNLKVKKGLEVINKGIEDEKRCEKVARAKEEIILQNRLSRLSKASERTARLTKASFTNMETTKSFLESTVSGREIWRRASEPFHKNSTRVDKLPQWKMKPWVSSTDGIDRPSSSNSDRRASLFDSRRKVRFDGKSSPTEDHRGLFSQNSLRRSSVNSQRSAPGSLISHSQLNRLRSNSDFFFSDEGSFLKSSTLPNYLDYYNRPLSNRITFPPTKGFSQNAASFSNLAGQRNSLNQLSGLKDEMHRWRRLSTTRATNARLKAVRVIGRRHASNMSLKDAMDDDARRRKDLAFRSQEFTPANAWKMLNCRYLRLTENNIKTLEEICGDAGYDVSAHPHAHSETEFTLKVDSRYALNGSAKTDSPRSPGLLPEEPSFAAN